MRGEFDVGTLVKLKKKMYIWGERLASFILIRKQNDSRRLSCWRVKHC